MEAVISFLSEYRLTGLTVGIFTFLIIGLFHPLVIKAEYWFGTRSWWMFLVLGIAAAALSVCVEGLVLSILFRRRRVLFVLEYPRSFPAAGTCAQGVVPGKSAP